MIIRTFAEIEREAILQAVSVAQNPVAAARMLGMGKTTVYRKLKEYGWRNGANTDLLQRAEALATSAAQANLLRQAASLRMIQVREVVSQPKPAPRYLQIPTTPLGMEQASLCCPRCRTMLIIPGTGQTQ